jgi:hypothetical protein
VVLVMNHLGRIAFSLSIALPTFAWAGEAGNYIVGGLLGLIGGAMGSVFVGGGTEAMLGGGDSLDCFGIFSHGDKPIFVHQKPFP